MNDKQKENLYWILGIVFAIVCISTFGYILYHPEIDFLIQIFLMVVTSLIASYFLSLAYQYRKINRYAKK